MSKKIWSTRQTTEKNIMLFAPDGSQFGHGLSLEEAKLAIKALQFAVGIQESDKAYDDLIEKGVRIV